ncbi:MAG: ion channel [Gammaproteobacteria bacterium]|nr:ion channel [Gammaproteobacteria bacterium]
MLGSIIACVVLIGLTTVFHYEILRLLTAVLPGLKIHNRAKVLVVIFSAFVAHLLEIGVYGLSIFLLVKYLGAGSIEGVAGFSLLNCLYFSAETYTSLGFGDTMPVGPVRLLAGIEALNGLLLIGWSASYTYIVMRRFWNTGRRP